MVELASKKFVCIVDESKLVNGLGGSKGKQLVSPSLAQSPNQSQAHANVAGSHACMQRYLP
jgi:ribose 5-phosphate isomerase